ncbi:MAG TPA: ribonuclease P protein component 4 [Candidatus Nanoarchaeia archaeon]|nr:ribonuclease P protein component 4 [Candidatus Nanoarchaeia archaeon]
MVKRKHRQKPARERRVALERIEHLFQEAEKAFKDSPKLSNRYVQLARKIGMKYKVKLSSALKKRFCKNCYSYLKPGVNCRVRLGGKKVVYYCFNCKGLMRFPYKK